MKNLIIIIALILSSFTSCFYAYYPQTGSEPQAETNPESIMIYSGDIDQDYTILGPVCVDVIGDSEAGVKFLKKKAAQLGADAVIKVELTKMNAYTIRTGISGIAVRTN